MSQPKPAITQPEVDTATASLDFEEFSFWDAESQNMENISTEHKKQLITYLSRKYGVFDMQISLPYLILFCRAETTISNVDERIGATDIGLAKLKNDIVIHNRFLDIPIKAKILVRRSDVKLNDKFFIDSIVTGMQRVRCQGVPIGVEGEREVLKADKNDLPGTGNFISLRQGVDSTGSPEIHKVPKYRQGCADLPW
ncbi:hypothetical protein MMC17_005419 [Xylographa soralifera]|nr:hypothetical protein [Xylographa soralifera]